METTATITGRCSSPNRYGIDRNQRIAAQVEPAARHHAPLATPTAIRCDPANKSLAITPARPSDHAERRPARPGPVLLNRPGSHFAKGFETRDRTTAIVTVVDAKHLLSELDRATHEAQEQLAFADVVLLNKTDLVSGDELATVEVRIRQINPYARIHRLNLDRVLEIEPEFLDEIPEHEHDAGISSLALTTDQPMEPEKFIRWIQDVAQRLGLDILRMKGIIAMQDDEQRFVIQGVHMLLEGDSQRAWQPGEKRESRLVFIGRNLPRDLLKQGFEACRA
jgi:G3E family GTPase